MELLIKLGIFLILVVVGYFRGRRNHQTHLRTLREEELTVKDVLVFATRNPELRPGEKQDPVLVTGSAVVSTDHVRYFLAGLRKFIGGNYSIYEELIHRARRQAMIRMKQAAKAHQASMVFQVKYETTQISNPRQGELPQVEVLAYGTAFVPAQSDIASSKVHYRPMAMPAQEEQSPFATFKNRYAQIGLAVTIVMVIYFIVESLYMRDAVPQLRYVNGAPWKLFWMLSAVAALLGWLRSKRSGLPLSDKILLSILFVPAMTGALYFMALRLNALTAEPMQAQVYILQADISLKPVNPELPVIHFDEVNDDYWRAQKTGSVISVPLQKGLLGFYQYDATPLAAKYREFYRQKGRW